MPWGFAAAALAVVGAAVSAYGQMQSADAASKASSYNAAVARNNAIIANQNAEYAAKAGEAQAEQASLKSRAEVGAIKANQAAGNVDVNSGSALDVRSSAKELGQLNAITVRSNAARTAYGYQTQATGYKAQSQLDDFESSSAKSSGNIAALGTVIGGLGKASSGIDGAGSSRPFGTNIGKSINAPYEDITWNE